MRISDWSSDVCSSDLTQGERLLMIQHELVQLARGPLRDIQTRLPLEERRIDARDENLHGAFLCMFHPSKNINRSYRVSRETTRTQGRPARHTDTTRPYARHSGR